MTERQAIGELDLLAYADGQLDPPRRAEVEAHLALHPEAAARVAEWREQSELMRELYGGVAYEPVPARLRGRLETAAPRLAAPMWRAAAAAGLLLATGLGGFWVGRATMPLEEPREPFLAELVAAHARFAAPDGDAVLAAETDLSPLSWLTQQITLDLQPPELDELGFALVDRRVLAPVEGPPAAQLTYEGPEGRVLTLYLRPRAWADSLDVKLATERGVPVAYGQNGPLIFGLAGELPRDELVLLARQVKAELGRDTGISPQPQPLVELPLQPAVEIGDGIGLPLERPNGAGAAEDEVEQTPM